MEEFVVEGHGENSGVGSRDQAPIRISQTPLLVPSETTPDRLGFHATIAAADYAFPSEKAPRLSGNVRRER